MSDENRGPVRPDNGKETSRRVGTAERDDAIALLDSWMWFLMVPVMGVVLFGPNGKNSGQGQNRDRNRMGGR